MGGSGGAPGAALAVVAPEAAGAVPDRVVAGEMPADEDAEAGAGAAARLFGQLEGHAIGGDDIVAAHDAFLLEAEHLLEVDAAERDKGGRRGGGRPAELVVGGGAGAPPEGVAGRGARGGCRGAGVRDRCVLEGDVCAVSAAARRRVILRDVP